MVWVCKRGEQLNVVPDLDRKADRSLQVVRGVHPIARNEHQLASKLGAFKRNVSELAVPV